MGPTAGLGLPEGKKNLLLLPGLKLQTVEPARFTKTFGIKQTRTFHRQATASVQHRVSYCRLKHTVHSCYLLLQLPSLRAHETLCTDIPCYLNTGNP